MPKTIPFFSTIIFRFILFSYRNKKLSEIKINCFHFFNIVVVEKFIFIVYIKLTTTIFFPNDLVFRTTTISSYILDYIRTLYISISLTTLLILMTCSKHTQKHILCYRACQTIVRTHVMHLDTFSNTIPKSYRILSIKW